jgi:hypothetical protein
MATQRVIQAKRQTAMWRQNVFVARSKGQPISMAVKKSKLVPEVKEKWIAALRSGEYIQGSGALKYRDYVQGETCHCALGVLCEVVAPEGFKQHPVFLKYSHQFEGTKKAQECYPNQNKLKELGIYPSMFKKIAMLNDDQQRSFEYIADFVEKNL